MIAWSFIPLAFALDLVLGDPQGAPHPVRWMGRAIQSLERRFRALPVPLTLSGFFFAICLIAGTWLLTLALIRCFGAVHPWLGTALEIVGLYFCISAKDLFGSALAVERALKKEGISAAREKLAMIVGRDVQRLDEHGVARAAVETVAENLVDGVLSPLFFAVIGGAPLAMAYKMVNTLDSMVGYKNDRYRDFGRAAARIDDAANWIPARLSVPVIALAAGLLGGNWRKTLKTAIAQGRRHTSPNAGYPEAAFAGALDLRLGGPNNYHGQLVEKPYIGAGSVKTRPRDIEKACELMMAAAIIWVAVSAAVILA